MYVVVPQFFWEKITEGNKRVKTSVNKVLIRNRFELRLSAVQSSYWILINQWKLENRWAQIKSNKQGSAQKKRPGLKKSVKG
jgi:hypothetical protein